MGGKEGRGEGREREIVEKEGRKEEWRIKGKRK